MSFSSTPLGQGRRLDHHTFLGKPPSTSTDSLPSYSYGAPPLGSRSPPKPTSPSRDRNKSRSHEKGGEDNDSDPALIRFARLKQREAAPDRDTRPSAPRIITTPPNPDRWSVKDTSVNIAAAFNQAANSEMSAGNNSLASTSRAPVPRSTSVEYEASAPGVALGQRKKLPVPPNKLSRPPVSSQNRKPPSKSHLVPDSEGEDDRNVRGKSPFEVGVNMAKQAIGAATFFVRQRSHEPEGLSRDHDNSADNLHSNGRADGHDSSYSYREEESAYLASKRAKKGRISIDNKAYKPTQSDEEVSEYSSDDNKPSKRRKSTKGGHGGPLTSLPVVGNSKKRKKYKRPTGSNKSGRDGGPEELSESEEEEAADVSTRPPASNTGSVSRPSREPQDPTLDDSFGSRILDSSLEAIPEVPEEPMPLVSQEQKRQSHQRRSRSRTPALVSSRSSAFSIGGFLGSIVNIIIRLSYLICSKSVSAFTASLFLVGSAFGKIIDILVRRPYGWARGASPLLRLVLPGITIFAISYALRNTNLASYLPTLSFSSPGPVYQPPEVPPANIGEISERIVYIENTLAGLSVKNERTQRQAVEGEKAMSKLVDRINSLESRLASEMKKAYTAEAMARDAVDRTINAIKQEMEVLQSQVEVQKRQRDKDSQTPSRGADDEARAKLLAFEERMSGVEIHAQEALELGRKALAAIPAASPVPTPGWWAKPGSAVNTELVIKSADGQDVSSLINRIVDNAVSRIERDGIGKADFAMFSAGARVVPSLTSPAFELKPKGIGNRIAGLFTGKGYFGFQPPVTALHYDTHAGRCWPFAGTEGQLGVMLAAPVYIEEITIDHLAKELAFDLQPAPRHMEVWGLVEGADNIRRLDEWKANNAARREAGEQDVQDEPPYPATFPTDAVYIRISTFMYDIEASNNVQTFPVDPAVRNLGIDFGIVVLRVLDNWGRDEYTCLYRFRVHGQKMGDMSFPYFEDS